MDEQAYWRWRRMKECGNKTRYLTKASAERNAPKPQVAYQCYFCKFFHTGHKRVRDSRVGDSKSACS